MASSRCRLICFVLALSILISLVPVGIMSAFAADEKLGKTTIDKVNVRVSDSNSAKLLFQIPKAGYVGTIKGESTSEKIHWYKVEFQSPEKDNDHYYIGYVNGNYFTPLTDQEASVYKANMTVATPTPIPPVGSTATATPVPQSIYASTDAPAGTTGTITSSGTNLRKGPGKSFDAITQLNRGEVVTVITIPTVESEQTFYRVRYGSTEGFIMSTYLKVNGDGTITPSPVTTPTPIPVPDSGVVGYVTTTKGGVKLRQTPAGTTITTVARNRTFPYLVQPVTKNGYTWYFVQADNYRGYLRGDCVKVVNGAAPTATPTGGAVITATPAPTATPTSAPVTTIGYIETIKGGVNLRKDAGGTIFASVAKGKTYPYMQTVIKNKYTWYYAQTEYGNGWLRNDCVKVVNGPAPTATPAGMTPTPAPTATPEGMTPTPVPTISPAPTATPVPTATPTPSATALGYVQTTKGKVNLRKAAGGSIIGNIEKKGSTYPYVAAPVIKNGYTWYYVQTEQGFGYLRSDCVKIVNNNTATPAPTATAVPTATPEGMTPTPAPTATPVPGIVTPSPTPAATGILGYIETTKAKVNLRKDAAGSVIGVIQKKGTQYPYLLQPVLKGSYTWYFVQTEQGYGYLRSDCVKVVKGPDPTATPDGSATATPVPTATPSPTPTSGIKGYVKTTATGVNLRKKAGYSDVIAQLKIGTVVPYYDTVVVDKVTWYHVYDSKNGFGYLHGKYVTLTDDKGNAATATPAPTGSSTATPAPSVTPGGTSQTEASYSTLRLGSSGNAVKNLVTELKNQGYFTGDIVSKYNSSVESAVKAFQRAKGLTVDGIAGPATQHALYGTVPIGSADTSNLSMTLYPAEKIDWVTGGIDELWKRGSNYKIYDVKTGIVWWAHRWAGGNHADIEPLTAADTARLCKIYGTSTAKEIADRDLYERRPCLVTIGTRTFACSLYGVPHNYPKGDTIPDNNYDGQACLHFTNSRTSDTNRIDSGHQAAIEYAWEHAPNGHK